MALNSQGQTLARYSNIRTLQAPPEGLISPIVKSSSAYSAMIAWMEPARPNGVISVYRLQYTQTMAYVNVQTGEPVTSQIKVNKLYSINSYI